MESSTVVLSKSPNKHNRIYATSAPLPEKLTNTLDDTVFRVDPARARVLADSGIEQESNRLWCFGPGIVGPNVLLDAMKTNISRERDHLNEIKPYCSSGFRWATSEGVLCEEPMRGVCVRILDVALQGDVIRRGGGQVIPTIRRAVHGSVLLANPTLQEPIIDVEICCPTNAMDNVNRCVLTHRGVVMLHKEFGALRQGEYRLVKCSIPASESFALREELKHVITNANLVYWTTVFGGWKTMVGSALEPGSHINGLVANIRIRKGLRTEIPPVSKYMDKL